MQSIRATLFIILKVKTMPNSNAQHDISMTVIGAGSYGTSLAIALARNGSKVMLWGHEPEHMASLEQDRSNEEFFTWD